jgi:hypothetical protein
MSSHPSQPPKEHIHIEKLGQIEIARVSEMARTSRMASHPSQL